MPRSRLQMLVSSASALLVVGGIAGAQLVGGPVRQDSGPLRERSTNVGDGGGPVRQGSSGVRATNAGRLSGNSVRGSVTGDLVSGPVGDITVGPVTSGQSISGRGAITDASAGAVTKDSDSPIRAGIAAPVHGLGNLQERLREIQPLPREETAPLESALAPISENPAEQPEAAAAEQPQSATAPHLPVPNELDSEERSAAPGEDAAPESGEGVDVPGAE